MKYIALKMYAEDSDFRVQKFARLPQIMTVIGVQSLNYASEYGLCQIISQEVSNVFIPMTIGEYEELAENFMQSSTGITVDGYLGFIEYDEDDFDDGTNIDSIDMANKDLLTRVKAAMSTNKLKITQNRCPIE